LGFRLGISGESAVRSLQRETARARKRKSEREREGKTCAQGGGQEIFFYIPLVCLRVQAGTDTALPVCIFFSYCFLHSLNLPLVFAYVYRQVRILLFMFFFLDVFYIPLVCLWSAYVCRQVSILLFLIFFIDFFTFF